MKWITFFVLSLAMLLADSSQAYEMTYNGRIFSPNGNAATSLPFYLRFDFKTVGQVNSADCYLYRQQTATAITSDEEGVFQVLLSASSADKSFGPSDLGNVFLYSSARPCFDTNGTGLSGINASLKPALELVVYFKENPADAWDEIDRQTIRPAAESLNTEYFGGLTPSAFIQATAKGTQSNFNALMDSNNFAGIVDFSNTGNLQVLGTFDVSQGTLKTKTPVANDDAATKLYVDQQVTATAGTLANYLQLTGGTMAGSLAFGGHDATGIGRMTQTANNFLQLSSHATSGSTFIGINGSIWYDTASESVRIQKASGVASLIDDHNTLFTTVGTPGTYTRVTTDAYGRVTLGANPTTLSGYGITDAGTVSSVSLAAPNLFTVSNPTITTAGTISISLNDQSRYHVLAAPNNMTGPPSFRALQISDIRSSQNNINPFIDTTVACTPGTTLTYNGATGSMECASYSLTLSQVTSALGVIYVNNGSVGIGTATPQTALDVAGGFRASAGISTTNILASGTIGVAGDVISGATVQGVSLVTTSDKRLKENVRDLAGLDLILGLHPVSFRWKGTGLEDIGFLAQEVEAVDSRLAVTNPETGIKGVKYSNIVAPLVQSTQELHEKITGLEAQVQTLSDENHQLREEIREIRELILKNSTK